MASIRRILVLVEAGKWESVALRRGVDLARAANAQLCLLMCVFDPMVEQAASLANAELQRTVRDHLINQSRSWLDERVATLMELGLRVEHEACWGQPGFDQPLARLSALAPDLVISDLLPAGKRQKRVRMRPADWLLARRCPYPLMFVAPTSAHLPRRILAAVGVAGNDAHYGNIVAVHLVRLALTMAALCNAELRLLHVFPYRRPSAGVRLSAGLRSLHRELRGAAQQGFSRLIRQHGLPASQTTFLEGPGDEAGAINRYANSEAADLVMIGAACSDRRALGGVAEALLHLAGRDLLLVRPLSGELS